MTRLQQEVSRRATKLGCSTEYSEQDGSMQIKYDGANICRLHCVILYFNKPRLIPNERNADRFISKRFPVNTHSLPYSDQGWQYQHAEYQRLLAEHGITQSMSRKENCMDHGSMTNFFGRLKVEMYYGEKFEFPRGFIEKLKKHLYY